MSATASAWARAVRKGSMKVSPWVSRLALADMQALSGEGCWWLQVPERAERAGSFDCSF